MVPKSAVASVRTRIPTETDWSTSRSARESTSALNARGRSLPPARDSSSGRRQSAPSRMNETTRTIAAVVKKDSGTGRSRTPPIP